MNRLTSIVIVAIGLMLAGASHAHATDWEWSIAPYVWTTDVGVNVSVANRQVVGQTIAFTDLVKDLDRAAQVRVEAQRGAHGFLVDIFNVQLSPADSHVPLTAGGAQAVLASTIGMSILDVAGLYDRGGDQQGLALIYGTRILSNRANFVAHVESAATTSPSDSYAVNDTLVDALVGARYTQRLSRRWSYAVRADVSTGETDMTWSGTAGIAYAFGARGRYELSLGYRYMDVNYASDTPVNTDMSMKGLASGFRIKF